MKFPWLLGKLKFELFPSPVVTVIFLVVYSGVLGTISRMAKRCALRLTPTKLYFILTDNAAVGGVSIWCELTQASLTSLQLVFLGL